MTALPSIASKDRVLSAVLVVSCGIAQAAALAIAAFATRDAFAALHFGDALAVKTIFALSLAGLTAALCLFFSRKLAEDLGQSYAIALRRAFYAKIARLPKSRHDQRRVGALSLRFVGDLSAARLWFGRGLPDVLTAIVVLPAAVAILFSLDPTLARVGLVPLAVSVALMTIVAWQLEKRHRRLRSRRANIAIAMIERIAIAPELDLMGRTDKELRALDDKGASLKTDAIARRGRNSALQAILQAGVALSGLAVLWFASSVGTAPAVVAASLSVLALVALPLQDLGAAWDHFCAWRVAKGKALRLLDEPEVTREAKRQNGRVAVTLCGKTEGDSVYFTANAGSLARLKMPNAAKLARLIAGLDTEKGIAVSYGDTDAIPRIYFVGDSHIGLQGSLRRSATLSARKRPTDARINQVLRAFGLGPLIDRPEGLEQRLSENGKGLCAGQTLRLDLARAILGKAEIIVISSLRWQTDGHRGNLLSQLQKLTSATIIIAENIDHSNYSKT